GMTRVRVGCGEAAGQVPLRGTRGGRRRGRRAVKIAEIRGLTDTETVERSGQRREELVRLRFRSATQELENSALLRNLRREIARLKTVLRERQLGQGER